MIVDNALYRQGTRVSCDIATQDLAGMRALATEEGDFVWVGLHEPTEAEMDRVQETFGLHDLAVEDAVSAHQRPKVERYDDTIFMILKTLWYVDETDAVETGEIGMFVGEGFVVTVRHGEGLALAEARRRLEGMQSVLAHGPTAVLYAVTDTVVDGYEAVGDELATDVGEVEDSVFGEGRTNDSARIYVLKREISEVRRAVLPLREPINRFIAGGMHGIDVEAAPYFRDIADHLARLSESIDSLDSLLSSAFDAHLAQISIQQNDDMRVISVFVGIIAAPTAIAGIYGMNFDHMPELHWALGYPLALLLMVASSLVIYLIARKHKWL
ncbi:MAG: magnesium/cobalt transporter CorA [Myxococcales bacterium]|nr:MAG: magnesium/cobalt transporter CorA [Myxococcales bacterium]